MFPTILGENLVVELATTTQIWHFYRRNLEKTTFAFRNSSGELRFFLELQKLSNFPNSDFIKCKETLSTLTGAARYMTDENLFCDFDCLQE